MNSPHVAHNSGNNEWYTPAPIVDAARAVLGAIDLDPASCDKANTVVQAKTYYTADMDGSILPWAGRVWLNPPYESGLVGVFVDKLAYHFAAGDVTEAIVLVNNATETGWFHRLAGMAQSIVFIRGRLRFWQSGSEKGTPLQGQAVLYLGPNAAKFVDTFRSFGWAARVN